MAHQQRSRDSFIQTVGIFMALVIGTAVLGRSIIGPIRPMALIVTAVMMLVLVIISLGVTRGLSSRDAGALLTAAYVTVTLPPTLLAGGLEAPVLPALVVAPLVAGFLISRAAAASLAGALALAVGLMARFGDWLPAAGLHDSRWASALMMTLSFVLIAFIAFHYDREESRLRDQLTVLVGTDGLTGLANRRRFDEVMTSEAKRAKRNGGELTLILLDIDDFKAYNDLYGHSSGDACLRRIGHDLHSLHRRSGEIAARVGGEEFGILGSSTSVLEAEERVQELRTRLEMDPIRHEGSESGRITLSIGIATGLNGSDIDDLYERADVAMYQAKHGGKDRVVVHGSWRPKDRARPEALRLAHGVDQRRLSA